MRVMRLGPLFVFSLLAVTAIQAQQASTSTPAPRDARAVLALQRSLAALTSTARVNDVTLTGAVTQIAGSDNDSGTVTLKATAIGQGRIDLNRPSGQRSEVRDISAAPPTGSWSGSDATWHHIANHNLLSDPTWFFPQFLIGRVLSNSGYSISSADAETMNGVAVQHIGVFQQYAESQQLPELLQGLSNVDIYLNSSNLLPVAIAFNIHADNDALTDIPVRIQFANYQAVQGVQVPYRVQEYLNNGLALDLSVETVQFNTGLSASEFTAQ